MIQIIILVITIIIFLIYSIFKPNNIIGGKEIHIPDIINKETPGKPYDSAYVQSKKIQHKGQRKLLLSEIDFLANTSKDNDTVIYVGAGPGYHINLLSDMFPKLNFILYDEREMFVNKKNVVKHRKLFTDSEAKTYVDEKKINILFISDIRTLKSINKKEHENNIYKNMMMQKKWIEIIKPKYSMVKFRIPFTKKSIDYFNGDLHFQVWARKLSTETRLWVKRSSVISKKIKTYDLTNYENALFYFNTETRHNNYDKLREKQIMDNFNNKYNKKIKLKEKL